MSRLLYIIKKEFIEITRDIMSLALLIIMPVTFIIIMSLSMQALFQGHTKFKIKLHAVDFENSKASKLLLQKIKEADSIGLVVLPPDTPEKELSVKVNNGEFKFVLQINPGFSGYINDINRTPEKKPVSMMVDPTVQSMTQLVIKNQLELEIVKLKLNSFFNEKAKLLDYVGIKRKNIMKSMDGAITTSYSYKDKKESAIPSAAQQSIPAWLVFGLYFLVVPMANIYHTERENGTLQRLKSINIPGWQLVSGKVVCYFMVGILQIALMLCVGRFFVPLMGGDTIQFGSSAAGLVLIAACIAFNATAFGLMLSVLSKNYMMATSLGIMINISLAAIGGIMVPTFIMPPALQHLSHVSPFSWAMQGFLDIILRNGGVIDIAPECLLLTGTAAVMLVIAVVAIRRKNI